MVFSIWRFFLFKGFKWEVFHSTNTHTTHQTQTTITMMTMMMMMIRMTAMTSPAEIAMLLPSVGGSTVGIGRAV